MKRIATLLAPEDLGPTGTKIIDINTKDIISRISMLWDCTNVTVSVMTAPVVDCISKIELVDGSEVIFSLSGAEAQALNFYDRKVMPHNQIGLTVGNHFQAQMDIDFGRYLWDADLALDPSRFKNPQLKITWDEDACNGSVTVNSFRAYAYVDEAPKKSPIGYLMSKEHEQYTMAASSHKYIDLPTDYAIKQLILRGLSTDHDPVLLYDTLKINIENGKFIPLDIKAEDYYQLSKSMYPKIVEEVTLDDDVTLKEIYANISNDQQIVIQQDDTAVTAAGEIQAATWTGAYCSLSLGVAVKSQTAIISGTCPHNCIAIPMGDHSDIESWLSASIYGSIRADLLSSSDADSGDTGYLVTQQLKTY